jgi:dihydropyrimidine dehydrogenase (NAD+) subunit PreA
VCRLPFAILCPVPGCITMVEVDTGQPPMDWNHDPRNPGG